MNHARSACVLLLIMCTALRADEPNLVGHWTFDEGSGEVAHDTSGRDNNGAIHGATWVECGDGHALQFDGDDDVVQCAASASLDLHDAVTLSAWVNPDRVPDMSTGIAGKSHVHFALNYYRNARVYWYIAAGSNNISTPLTAGRWHHVAATFDGKLMRIYIDGELAETGESKHPAINAGGTFSIGRIASRPEYPPIGTFIGRIDNVRLYNIALDDEAIARQHASDSAMYQQDSMSQAAQWQAVPGAVRREATPSRLEGHGGETTIEQAAGYTMELREDGGVRFAIRGLPPSERTMQWRRALHDDETHGSKWFMLRYRAEGFRRGQNIYPVVRADGVGGSVTLLDCAQIINDGLEHVMLGAIPAGVGPSTITVEVSTTGRSAYLDVIDIAIIDAWPTLVSDSQPRGGQRVVDLANRCNDTIVTAIEKLIAEHGVVTDPIAAFPGSSVGMIRPDEDDAINQQVGPFLGAELPRKLTDPVSRDDTIDVVVNDKVSEILLLLVADAPPTASHYSRPDTPLHIADVEAFAVELVYNDGASDWAFPYSVADRGYVIRRAVGTYAVAADETRTLSKVRLHNRWWGINIAPAGFVVNTGERAFPQLVAETPPRNAAHDARQAMATSVTRDGDRITMQTGFVTMTCDVGQGFAITSLNGALNPTSGIEVQVGDRIYTGRDFTTGRVQIAGNRLSLSLTGQAGVDMALNIEPRDGQIVFSGSVTNTTDEPTSLTFRAPVLKGLVIDSLDDTWLFFPKYRNELSNRHGTHIATNDRAFALQFYDIFNPATGRGVAVLTHNLSGAPLEYRLAKSDAGVTASVDYPADNYVLAPHASMNMVETCIAAHAGDWHAALELYQQWRKTWYEPHHATHRDWFDNSFLLQAIFVDEHASQRIAHTPPWYTGTPGQFRIDGALDATRRYWGMLPDIIHVGGWFHSERGELWSWGDYDYSEWGVGGLSSFRQLLRTLEKSHGIHTSLYTLADRASKGSKIGDAIGEQAAQRNADGSLSQSENAWYLDPSNARWRDHFVQTLERIVRDTGVQSMYIDVFSFYKGHISYNQKDGYREPTQPNRMTLGMITRVRDALGDVPIWSEYPVDDVSSQYHDGNIAYYYLTLHSLFAQSHDIRQSAPVESSPYLNVYRFALPQIKQFGFPVGIEGDRNPSRLRMLFFNGEALFDCTWRLFGDRLRQWMGRGIEVQRQYADCFGSRDVAMLTPTLRDGVYANRFAGDGRTAWTVYNARFRTVRGEVLAIEHIDGATYVDAWHGRPLHPRIENGRALIEMEIGPQACGCVVRQVQ